jgi:hypothetical protein
VSGLRERLAELIDAADSDGVVRLLAPLDEAERATLRPAPTPAGEHPLFSRPYQTRSSYVKGSWIRQSQQPQAAARAVPRRSRIIRRRTTSLR